MTAGQRLTRSDLERMLGFVAELGAAEDVASLRDRTMAELRDLLAPDGVGYTEIDRAGGGAGFWSDPAELAGEADADAFAEFLHQHPVAAYHERNGGEHAVQLADFLTGRQLHALELYNDFYRPLGIEHQLAISVDTPGPISIPISVHRGGEAFSERDRAALELLHPHLENAHRRLAARIAAQRILAAVEQARGAALITLGGDGRIEAATGRALVWLHRYFDPEGTAADRLPRELASWLDGVRALSPGERANGGDLESVTIAGADSTLLLRFLPARSRWEHDLLLLEERRTRPDPAVLRARGLTPREAEVLTCAAGGGTDAQIARELAISVRTVHKHLQAAYRKLDVVTRTAAVAKALQPADVS